MRRRDTLRGLRATVGERRSMRASEDFATAHFVEAQSFLTLRDPSQTSHAFVAISVDLILHASK
jgi:hypothetical protein